MTVSGQESVVSPNFSVPEGMALVTKAEHDQNAAELRRLRKQAQDRERADQDAAAARARQEAEAAGNYQQALAAAEARRQLAEDNARALSQREALRDAIMLRGYAGEQAAAIVRLANTANITPEDPASAVAAVDSVVTQFSSLFSAPAPGNSGTRPAPAPAAPRPASPAAPVVSPNTGVGFLTMEEYLATPFEARMTPEFQKRVQMSQPRWPTQVPANSFAQES